MKVRFFLGVPMIGFIAGLMLMLGQYQPPQHYYDVNSCLCNRQAVVYNLFWSQLYPPAPVVSPPEMGNR
jgi:hypothetical protein